VLKEHFEMLAGYNAWANTRLYAAAATLGEDEYHADRAAFFRSMHGTLSHILAADRIWMRTFTGEGKPPTRTDVPLFDRFAELRDAREREDARIAGYIQGLDTAALYGDITYRRVTTPEVITQPLRFALAHFFNHQTHHRGQAHALLTGLGKPAPDLDLAIFQRLPRDG
jgi:uncharacterized damage-inducible protein DinB